MRRRDSDADSPVVRLERLVEAAIRVARTAKRNRANLTGLNFYADKMARLRTDATVEFEQLGEPSAGAVSALAELLEITFAPKTRLADRVSMSRDLMHELRTQKWRAAATVSGANDLFPLSLLTKTNRGYLISVGRQMNGCFASGFFDASAVMMRRLLETAIIEAFESKKLDAKIKNPQGDYVQLTDLIAAALAETTWNLTRNTKQALPRLREIGHLSAHSRRFTAQKGDIQKVQPDCRVAVEEFLQIAGLV